MLAILPRIIDRELGIFFPLFGQKPLYAFYCLSSNSWLVVTPRSVFERIRLGTLLIDQDGEHSVSQPPLQTHASEVYSGFVG